MAGEKLSTKSVNLALQGGGAHGAFTWGVLDRLLEDGRLAIEGISGTSAGAVNAVVLADGYGRGGRDGAREALHQFWYDVSREGSLNPLQRTMMDAFMSVWSVATESFSFLDVAGRFNSPYETNPLDINPLRDALAERIDFDRVNACAELALFVAATNVFTGKIRVFRKGELSAESVMASACLPFLFRAVEIDGVPYWDGGYTGNPALFPLFGGTKAEDILLVQINPIERRELPRSRREILDRVNEITFNAPLLRELRAIDFVNRLIEENRIETPRYTRNRLHRIDADTALADYGAYTRLDTSWRFLRQLRDLGREAAGFWLSHNYDAVGHHSTLDLRAAFS